MKILKALQSFTTCTFLQIEDCPMRNNFENGFFFNSTHEINYKWHIKLFKNGIYRFTINLRIITLNRLFFFLFGCGFRMVGCLIVSHRFVFLHSPTDEPRAEPWKLSLLMVLKRIRNIEYFGKWFVYSNLILHNTIDRIPTQLTRKKLK